MTDQLALAGVTSQCHSDAKPLTDNQQLAFDYIRASSGVTTDEIGAWIHAHRTKRPHGVDERCDWCAKTGQQLVTSKGLTPLVTFRKAPGGRLYVARRPEDRVVPEPAPMVEPTEAELAANPFAGL